jgi:DNA-directed RNA polymerase specialized sigma24 family protein
VAALERIDDFEPRREGAFLAYLRQILLNSIWKEIRKKSSRPVCETLKGDFADATPSSVEQAIGLDAIAAYEKALAVSYVRQGKYQGAEILFRDILTKSLDLLGPTHISVVAVLGNLGSVLQEQGKFEKPLTT